MSFLSEEDVDYAPTDHWSEYEIEPSQNHTKFFNFLTFAVAGCLAGLLSGAGIFLFKDEVLNTFLVRQAQLRQAYEDRIVALRSHIDEVTSQQLLDQVAFDTRIDALIERQKQLREENAVIRALLEKAEIVDKASLGDKFQDKVPGTEDGLETADAFILDKSTQPERKLALLDRSIGSLDEVRSKGLASLELKVDEKVDRYASALDGLGVPSQKLIREALDQAMGGPFEPVISRVAEASVGEQLQALDSKLAARDALKDKLNRLPIFRPMSASAKITSKFGPRRDPFNRRLAFHGGIDFRGHKGTPVFAAGKGKVVRAGRAGGYGLMVEVRHAEGYLTRYAHLSKILVKRGDAVAPGVAIGKVGSTGRSTGPHLHFEVRKGGKATDPIPFLKVGKQLSDDFK